MKSLKHANMRKKSALSRSHFEDMLRLINLFVISMLIFYPLRITEGWNGEERREELNSRERNFNELKAPMEIHHLFMPEIELDSERIEKDGLVSTILYYVKKNPEWIKDHSIDDLQLMSEYEIPEKVLGPHNEVKPRMSIVHFKQQIQDPLGELDYILVEGSFLRFIVKHLEGGAVIVDIQSQLFDIELLEEEALLKEEAINSVEDVLNLSQGIHIYGGRHSIRFIDGQWRRIYEFRYDGSGQRVLVDTYSGEFWTTSDIVYAQQVPRVSDDVKRETVLGDVEPIEDPEIIVDSGLNDKMFGHWKEYFRESLATVQAWNPEDYIFGYVYGMGVLFDPVATGNDLDLLRLSDLQVYKISSHGVDSLDDSDFTYTNFDGYFFFRDDGTPDLEIYASLRGKWADVEDASGPTLEIRYPFEPGVSHALVFNNSSHDPFSTATAQVNGYYHTTFIHNWLKERIPSLTSLDITMPVTVNESPPTSRGILGSCDARYDPSEISIHFGPAPEYLDYCGNLAIDTVIYHEYGHFVDDMAGGITDRALSEGWGDTLSAYLTSQPLWGEGLGGEEYLRTVDNDYQYPDHPESVESHALGQAWSGFGWHLREDLINFYYIHDVPYDMASAPGINMAEYLILNTLLANSQDIPSAVYDVFLIDDDDGNLGNGTPHGRLICQAAQRHSIPMDDQIEKAIPCSD